MRKKKKNLAFFTRFPHTAIERLVNTPDNIPKEIIFQRDLEEIRNFGWDSEKTN